MKEENRTIACIIMASGLSERYGKNKLLEKLGGREVILHTADSLAGAGQYHSNPSLCPKQ